MKKILLLTLTIILIPLFIIGLTNRNEILNKIKYGFYSKSESASKSNDELTVWQVGNKTIILTTKVVVHENSEPLKGSEIVYDLSSANDDFYQLVEVIITNTDIEKKREMLKLEKMREINNQEQSVINCF